MTTDPAAAAANEIDGCITGALPELTTDAIAAIIRRHYADASAGRQGAVERLVKAADDALWVASDLNLKSPDGLWLADQLTQALSAFRSLPPDPQDAALTAEREALLRRAVGAITALKAYLGTEYASQAKKDADTVLADAERLGITGDAK